MLNALKRKFILLYTISTGFILTSVLVIVMFNSNKQLLQEKENSFLSNFSAISRALQLNKEISHLWLSQMETENLLLIHIEDNGTPLLYQGVTNTPTKRELLLQRLKEAALTDNINTLVRPVSLKELQSRTYQIEGLHKDRYLGAVFIVPSGKGFRSLLLLQYLNSNPRSRYAQLLFAISIDLLGIIGLFFVSRWIVEKSLFPVEESRQQQTEFIAAASHELKSPLAVIRANASAVKLEPTSSSRYLEGIDSECSRMALLIEDMLLLASADTNRWQAKMEYIDMDTLLIELYDTYYPYCKEKSKELKLMLPANILPRVKGDSVRIKQLLAILIDNAAAYTVADDTILLRAGCYKKQLIIEVEDHGPGIADERKKDVFRRFYREDKGRKDKNHYGLGLSIAKELAELHKGTIGLRDTLGGGATFYFSIPIDNS